jgi:hypothetical protein
MNFFFFYSSIERRRTKRKAKKNKEKKKSMNVVFKEAKEQLILEAKPRVINLI